MLFARRVPAREFKNTDAQAFDSEQTTEVVAGLNRA